MTDEVFDGFVHVRGVTENNLASVDVDIPRNAFVAFTGVSGSGKSSLAFGTLYAEAQRRYFESVAPYARRLLEAQRIKIATELQRARRGHALYLLDEPTSGLHPADVALLMRQLHALVDAGDTVVVVEHDLDAIASADWVIDLGPGGGDNGGTVVATGTPDTVAGSSRSATAPYLARHLTR